MDKRLIQEFIFLKKNSGEIKNQEEFGLKIGYNSKSAFSQAIAKHPLPDELILKINSVFPEFSKFALSLNNRNSNVESVKDFKDLSIEEKLSSLYEENQLIKSKAELIETKFTIAQEINRVYLKAIIVQLGLDEDLDEEIVNLENKLKKISSN